MMLGTNDSEGYTLPGAKTFVDSLLADDPNCKIAIGILALGRPCEGMPTAMERKLKTANVEYLDTFDNGKYHANVTCIGQGCWMLSSGLLQDTFLDRWELVKISAEERNLCALIIIFLMLRALSYCLV